MSNTSDKSKAVNILIDIVADDNADEQDKQDALVLIGHLSNEGTCLNHVPDSWGACENCGGLVF